MFTITLSQLEDEYPVLRQLNFLVAVLSVLGASTIIVLFSVFVSLRKFFSRLVVYLAIADFWQFTLTAFGHFSGPSSGCLVQGAGLTYFGVA